ncbi:MAG: hypothetical protein U0Q15_03650 [Kineosporiaceae bacterium]
MIRITSTPDGAPSGRRLAAGAAGAVLALTALIAVPAAGALGTGAAGVRTAATGTTTPPYPTCGAGGEVQPFCTRPPTTSITTTSRTTPPVPCGGSAKGGVSPFCTRPPTTTIITTPPQPCGGAAGQIKPFCTHPPTTSPTGTAPVRLGLIDFEDGDLRAWTTTVPQVRLKVTKAARQAGRYGLRISDLYRAPVGNGTSSTVNAYLTESRFAGTGELRKVTLQLRPSKVAAGTPKYSCGGPTGAPDWPKVIVTLTSGSVRATTTVALTSTSWTTVTLVVPAPALDGENVMLGISRAGNPTKAPLFVDTITLDRVSAPTSTPTPTATVTATSAAAPAAVVHPLCTTK